jgi:nucleoside-diphosphate-sugar epimerase
LIDLTGRVGLVTGASGFLGSWVVERLLGSGARVRCLVRSTSRLEFLPVDRVEVVSGDVNDRLSLERALVGVDYVFHLAGRIKASSEADYDLVNRQGTSNVVSACATVAPGVSRVVLVSSLAAIGPSEAGRPVDEATRPHPISPYGRSKLTGEQAALAFQDRLPLTVVRPPTIYGPRDRETLLVMRVLARGIRPVLPRSGAISLVHVADLADGILAAATHSAAVGKTYFLSGDEAPNLRELVDLLGAATETRGVPVPVSPLTLRLAGRAAEIFRDLTGRALIFDRYKAEEIARGYWACANQRARAEIGFSPRIALADGLRQTAEWYRKVGWL